MRTGRLASVYRVTSRVDFFAAAATLLGVLLFETLPGLVIGIAVSLGLLIARTSRPHTAVLVPVPQSGDAPSTQAQIWVDSERNPDLPAVAGLLVVRVEAPLMFTNADVVREQIRDLVADSDPRPTVVVLDGRTTPSIDVTAAGCSCCSVRTCVDWVPTLVMADDVGQVRDVLTVAEPDDEPPMYVTIEEAIAAASKSRDETGR